MTHLSAATRATLLKVPMPTLSDGSGLLAEWGAGVRPDGRWGVYTMNDCRTPTWAGIEARDAREAIAISRLMNGRAQLTDDDDRARMALTDPLWARYLDGDR